MFLLPLIRCLYTLIASECAVIIALFYSLFCDGSQLILCYSSKGSIAVFFCYLGSMLQNDEDRDIDADVCHRIRAGWMK